ncbi:TetR/AcrR family transcriptional regulator [Actinacidiphila acididurans]|uniref:TetR/AcrR family transcriptional regulator n=1 Tax=Actinacidiphila acididurans TaxID=2784346 RepID=A0ABS2TJF8_9ACTN|nr:TetR/AcrR family transcriptional regulator [Actinacidiphila acididurans]MBM9503478.1 TetR/AcrR family transcriptional regulator [Actinacidiphila acididurans]
MDQAAARPLRRDAEENLERVLAAAAAVFAEHGMATSIEVVAQRAGVGLGTVYRRFPNKRALLDELARRLLADAVDVAERHLGDPDGTGLENYFWEIGELLAGHSGLVARMWTVPGASPLVARSRAAQGELLAAAQRRGRARPELTAEDVAVTAWSLQGVLDVTRGVAVEAWRRHLEVLLAGLAPHGPALRHPALTPAGMDAVISAAPAGPPDATPGRRTDTKKGIRP